MLPRTARCAAAVLVLALATGASVARAEGDAPPGPTTAGPSAAELASLPDPLAAGWHGAKVCERLHQDDRLRVLRCTFPPGVGHERHRHAPHWGYAVVGGRMRVEDAAGVRTVDLPDGYAFDSPGVPWHEVVNVGETTAVFLIVEPLDPAGMEGGP
jgi:quercetin dioxygenase-like cupin family protein